MLFGFTELVCIGIRFSDLRMFFAWSLVDTAIVPWIARGCKTFSHVTIFEYRLIRKAMPENSLGFNGEADTIVLHTQVSVESSCRLSV
jgi:hypothetical protein